MLLFNKVWDIFSGTDQNKNSEERRKGRGGGRYQTALHSQICPSSIRACTCCLFSFSPFRACLFRPGLKFLFLSFAAGASPYSVVPTSAGGQPGQMISPPPPGSQDSSSLYSMSLNGGDSSYQSMGANVQSQVGSQEKLVGIRIVGGYGKVKGQLWGSVVV